MSIVHGKAFDHTLNTVALEGYCRQVNLAVDNDVAEKTASNDTAKEWLEGVYGWQMTADYLYDSAAGAVDATIYAAIMSGEYTVDMTPAGGSVGAQNPKYTGTAYVESYDIDIPVDGMCMCHAQYTGDGALSRAVA